MTADATVKVLVRVFGQHQIHVADVPVSAIRAARFGDMDVTAIQAPAVARCGTLLRGRLVLMAGGVGASRCHGCREAR